MAAHDLLAELDKRVLVCEGAMGSMLSADGTVVRDTGEMNLIAPEKVAAVHKAYQDAGANVFQSNTLTCNEEMLARTGHESAGGAEVFQSNTFTANEEMLARKGLADKSDDIARAGVRLLREAVGPDAFVAGGAGPTGKLVEPYGELSLARAEEVYRKQAEAMLDEGVDFLLLETFEVLEEVEAGVRGLRQADGGVPIAVTISFSSPGGRTMMGNDGVEVAGRLQGLGIEIIGANCGDPGSMLAGLEAMSPETHVPMMAQANAGVPQLVDGKAVFAGTPEESAELAVSFLELGVRIVGGCCGTTPEHIARIAEVVAAFNRRPTSDNRHPTNSK